jgi:hypothetical protein
MKNKDQLHVICNCNFQLDEFNIDQIRTKGKKI